MITNCYSIYDNKALIYHVPWFSPTHGAATRMLSDMVNDLQTGIGRHPGDYVLYRIGTYDDAKGQLIPLSPLEHVVDAVALLQRPPELFAPNVNSQAITMNGKESL